MKKKVISVFFKDTITAPPVFGGESTLNADKWPGVEMHTGEEPGFLTVKYNDREIGVPLSNCKSLVWESCKSTGQK